MKNTSTNRPIVSAIIEKTENNTKFVYLHTRWKPQSSPTYSGLLEIPAGTIETYENIISALKREVKEETDLSVIRINGGFIGEIEENIAGNKSMVFQPFVCQQVLSTIGGLPWIGYVFRCEVKGNVKCNIKEAKDPQWVSLDQLNKLLIHSPKLFFPLQFPVLKYYAKTSNKE